MRRHGRAHVTPETPNSHPPSYPWYGDSQVPADSIGDQSGVEGKRTANRETAFDHLVILNMPQCLGGASAVCVISPENTAGRLSIVCKDIILLTSEASDATSPMGYHAL